MSEKIPTISICNLLGANYSVQDLVVYDLKQFLSQHKDIKFPHRHSFYQILYITGGDGFHIIDFERHILKKGTMYFLAPAQVHEWLFEENVNGILINFNEHFFGSFLANSHYIAELSFFNANGTYSAIDLTAGNLTQHIEPVLAAIKREFDSCGECRLDLIKVLLLQVFLLVNRSISITQSQTANNNYLMLRHFEKLIEQNYTKLHLPKEYARLLFVTPNHLNSLCNQLGGKSAGEMIRNRILLEAKRLLVNSTQNINEIAWHLNFADNSYFSKFFKKYEGVTPDEFRKLKNYTR